MLSLLAFIGTPHTVEWEQNLGDTGDGSAFAAAVDVPSRIEPDSRQIQLPDSRVVLLTARIYMPGTVPVKPGDRITVHGRARRVELVDTPVWFDGRPMHHEVGVM